MHKLLQATVFMSLLVGTSVAANAADLPPAPAPAYKAPAVVAPPPFSWTGFYVGGNLGAGWSQGNVTDSAFGLSYSTGNNVSFIGGGQVGANYQINSFV